MNNTTEGSEESIDKAKSMRTIRIIWTILIVAFAAIIILQLYEWANGKDNFRSILAPFGMIFVGAGALVRPRNVMLSYILTGIALVLVVTGLVLMIIY